MPELSFSKDFKFEEYISKVSTSNDTSYFDRWDRNLHHKQDYEINRTLRRLQLTEAFENWFNDNTPYAVVRDPKNDFRKTKATILEYKDGMNEEKTITTSYPLYQSLLNIVKRGGYVCECPDDKKPCNKARVWWNISIPHFIVVYRHGATSPWYIPK